MVIKTEMGELLTFFAHSGLPVYSFVTESCSPELCPVQASAGVFQRKGGRHKDLVRTCHISYPTYSSTIQQDNPV